MLIGSFFTVYDVVEMVSAKNGTTIYVDDDASSEWYDLTHFDTIQAAIDAASLGDTIYVYSGIYYENIVIDKPIDLIGENMNSTIIDGFGVGTVVTIFANGVEITAVTIRNSGNSWREKDAGVKVRGNHTRIISDIIIDNGYIGIDFYSSCCNVISGSIISDNSQEGIKLVNSRNNNISYSIITNNGDGISLDHSSNSTIINNSIINNNEGGIELHKCDNINITANVITGNRWTGGIYLDDIYVVDDPNREIIISYNNISSNNVGILFFNSNNNTIIGNTISENGNNGISVIELKNSIIAHNTITSNGNKGIHLSGTSDQFSSNNTITNNVINNNDNGGIHIDWKNINNIISNNTVTYNLCYGILLSSFNKNNIITNNTIIHDNSNAGSGINIERVNNTNNRIFYNNFINKQHAIDDSNNIWYNVKTKKGNYWSSYDGKDSDGDGIGDTPYYIPGAGNNKDEYPVMKPFGGIKVENKESPDFELIFTFLAITIFLFWKRQRGRKI